MAKKPANAAEDARRSLFGNIRELFLVRFVRLIKRLKLVGLLLAIVVAAAAMYMLRIQEGFSAQYDPLARLFYTIEAKTIDLRFMLRGHRPPGDEIMIAAIDEKSLRSPKLGRWPWDRGRIGELVRKLVDHGVRVIAFDVLFLEPQNADRLNQLKALLRALDEKFQEKSGPLAEYREELERQIALADEDMKFAEAVQYAGEKNVIVTFATHFTMEEDVMAGKSRGVAKDSLSNAALSFLFESTPYPGPEAYASKAALREYPPALAVSAGVAIDPLISVAVSQGYVNYLLDFDGPIRRERMVIRYKDHFYAPMALEAARRWLELGGYEPKIEWEPSLYLKIHISDPAPREAEGKALSRRRREITLPLQLWSNAVWIDYCGDSETFPTVSVVDILEHPEKLRDSRGRSVTLRDKLVFVGMSAAGLRDTFVTPFSGALPGVEKHATVAENILHGRVLRRMFADGVHDLGLILGFALFLGLLLPRVPSIWALVITVALLAGHAFHSYLRFAYHNVITNFVCPTGTILLCYGLIIFYRFMTEERAKRQIRGMFERYLDPAVVKELEADPNKIQLGGEAREITAFFSDVQKFSTISEKLSPHELIVQLNDYLSVMSDIIMRHRGLVDKFEGDAIVALFNAPNDVPNHAAEACFAAIEMQQESVELRRRFVALGRDEWYTRIGLNTGLATVGNVGTEQHMGYTMIGDEVNLAARLEGANKQYGTYIMISESTYRQARDFIEARELDQIFVVGKKVPVRVYQLISKKGDWTQKMADVVEQYEKGLALYRQRAWDEALRAFQKALEIDPADSPSITFVKRCQYYKENPPPAEWNGVFELKEK